jgi:hypothetical protein
MKMNQFRAILAVATVATSITASSLPSHAFTWDDLWNAVKKGAESSSGSGSSQPSNSSDSIPSAPTSSGFSDNPGVPENRPEPRASNADNNQPVRRTPPLIRRDDLTFQLFGCKKENVNYTDVLKCHFKITYVGNDEMKDFRITNARAISALDGNQYSPYSMTVAGQEGIDMIKGQPIHGAISFLWAPALKRLSTLEFETNNTSRKISLTFKRPQPRPVVDSIEQ